jgi:hypothetical protein
MLGAFKNTIIVTGLLSAVFLFAPNAAIAGTAPQFQSDQDAQQHCPDDKVVWVNTKTGVYHFKGQRWYGATKEGAYECSKDANGEGDRATKNGQ